MKYFIITLWLICGLAASRAGTLQWQGPEDFVTWLQSRHELNVQEYMESLDALAQFENRGGFDVGKYNLAANLIDDLAFRRFAKLREARDLLGTMEYFETEYLGTLKSKMIDALSDGKNDEFSARIVHHALASKSWAPPRQNTEFLIEGFEQRRKLYNNLAGGAETFDSLGSDFTLEQQQVMKRALEKKWPELAEVNTREPKRKPPDRDANQDATGHNVFTQGSPIAPAATDSKGEKRLLIVGLVLSAVTFLIVIVRRRLRRN